MKKQKKLIDKNEHLLIKEALRAEPADYEEVHWFGLERSDYLV